MQRGFSTAYWYFSLRQIFSTGKWHGGGFGAHGGVWGPFPLPPSPSAAQRDHQHCSDHRPIRTAIPRPKTSSKLPFQKATAFPPPWPPALLLSSRPKRRIWPLLCSRLCTHISLPDPTGHHVGVGASRWESPAVPSCIPPPRRRMLPEPFHQPGTPGCPAPGRLGAGRVADAVMCPLQLQLWVCLGFFPQQPSL